MPQFLFIGVILSLIGVILANWQKVLTTVLLISLVGFGIMVLVNGMSVEAAFDSLLGSLSVVWGWLVSIGQSVFNESKDVVNVEEAAV